MIYFHQEFNHMRTRTAQDRLLILSHNFSQKVLGFHWSDRGVCLGKSLVMAVPACKVGYQ